MQTLTIKGLATAKRQEAGFYTISDAARMLGIEIGSFHNWLRRDLVARPTHRRGAKKYYRLNEIEAIRSMLGGK